MVFTLNSSFTQNTTNPYNGINSSSNDAFNLDNLLNGLSDLFLGSGSGSSTDGFLDGLDLEGIFSFLGDDSFLSSLDLGGLLSDLGVNLFSEINLSDLLGGLDAIDLGGFTIGDIAADLGSMLEDLNLGDLFAGLDDDYSYLFDSLSSQDLFKAISQIQLPTDNLTPVEADLLDGFGSILSMLGAADRLDNFGVTQLVRGSLGIDSLVGDVINDCLLGLAGNDKLIGYIGNDLLNGGVGNDVIKGLLGNDVMAGMDGNDRLFGDKGNDIFYGGAGTDTFTTGKGRDLCVLGEGLGREIIQDFRDGFDKLGLMGDIDFNDLDITQAGRNALVSYGKEALVLLKGVNGNKLTSSDFVHLG